jgi:hypothetical protein
MIKFYVETDTTPPSVVRVYKEEDSNSLKLITNEAGTCVYSTTETANPCSYLFEEGVEMTSTEDKEFTVEWDTEKVMYVKCKDKYDRQPDLDECSIIIRPFEIAEVQ